MKSFLNVLYRRILYKIPLKRLLVGLAVFAVLFASFSSASYQGGWIGNLNLSAGQDYEVGKGNANVIAMGDNLTFCVFTTNSACNLKIHYNGINVSTNASNWQIIACITGVSVSNSAGIPVKNEGGSCTVGRYMFMPSFDIPQYTSLQCQTEYSLIPVSSVDQNYCTTNNLCPVEECPDVPVYTGDMSNLYINNILHLGAPNIIMNIPDEIDWDYAYTAGGQNMNIDVVGYNVDYEKIDSIVAFQNYKPSSEDFQKIIGLLAPYTKIIVFFVFLFIVWAWIKKPFKSKKL